MRAVHQSISAISLLIGSIGFDAPVVAADPQPDAVASTNTEDVIVVTSQFRRQPVTEVPLAVTAYDGKTLTDLNIDEFRELSKFVPGFVVQQQNINNPGFVLRGITSNNGAANVEPRVSIFQNNVTISRSRGALIQLFDLERVEVLKGPQGTLFGRSAQTGAVHVITNKPSFENEAAVTFGTGNFDQQRYEGFINVPLIDETLAIRLAGAFNRRAGFLDNLTNRDLNGRESLSLRGSLRFQPSDDLTIDVIGHYSSDDPPGTGFKSGVIPALGGDIDPFSFATLNSFGNFLSTDELLVERGLFDVTAIIDWTLTSAWNLTSTTAYREFDSFEIFDPDGSALDLFVFGENVDGQQWSSDVRLRYDGSDKLKGFLGGGIFLEKGRQFIPLGFDVGTVALFFGGFGVSTPVTQAFLTGNPAIVNAMVSASGLPVGAFQEELFINEAENVSFDLFGELSYALTDRMELTVGGRYTRDDKLTRIAAEITQPNPITPFIVGAPGVIIGNSGGVLSSEDDPNVGDNFDGFVWRVVLNYELTDDIYTYFNYSRGRRPQVLQDDFAVGAGGALVGGFEEIPAEIISSYEIGLKGRFFDDLVTLESAAFLYDYTNFQARQNIAGPGELPFFELVNGGTAESIGVELGLNVKPNDLVSFFFTYGFNRGRFDEVGPTGLEQEFGGNQFRLSPDHSLSAGFTLDYDTDIGRVFFTPTYTYKSMVFFGDENQGAFDITDPAMGAVLASVASQSQDGFGLINLRAGIDLLGDRITLEGYVQNLADQNFLIDAGNAGGNFGIPTFIAGPPRFYGGAITVRY